MQSLSQLGDGRAYLALSILGRIPFLSFPKFREISLFGTGKALPFPFLNRCARLPLDILIKTQWALPFLPDDRIMALSQA